MASRVSRSAAAEFEVFRAARRPSGRRRTRHLRAEIEPFAESSSALRGC
jgi:hypothetical protein